MVLDIYIIQHVMYTFIYLVIISLLNWETCVTNSRLSDKKIGGIRVLGMEIHAKTLGLSMENSRNWTRWLEQRE